MGPIRPTRDAERTRAALLLAGRSAFAERGYEGARTQKIADGAGVNKAMINYYFGGKQGLFSAVLLDGLSDAISALAPLRRDEDPPMQRLSTFIDTMASFFRRSPDVVLILVREQMGGARHIEPEVRRRFFAFFQTTREILGEGLASGRIRDVDAHSTHLILVGSLTYYLLTEPARATYASHGDAPGEPPSWETHVRNVRELFLRGLAAEQLQKEER
ncbi:MAG: TetR/AcrR family transcriptional regulator [Gemmatimonadota bacterium]